MSRRPVANPTNHEGKNVVAVVFPNGSRTYHYNCDFPVLQGDTVMVHTPSASFVPVTIVDKIPGYRPGLKSVIPAAEIDRMKSETAARERRFEIIKRLNAIQREQDELARFTALARRVPEARKLLAELKKLG